jgi:transposase
MSKARVVVLEVTSGHLTVTGAARTYGLSRQHIYRLLKRYELGGLDAVEPRSRRPVSNPRRVSDDVVAAVVLQRERLTADGLDAGPLTLQSQLARQGLPVPSTSTIRRILHHHGLIEPQPRKRPKSSYIRFAAEQPNECWQSGFTHWTLADGTDTEILNWLDDHSRNLLACTAYRRVNGGDVGGQLHPHRTTPRVAGIHPHRQRIGLHLTVHTRPQRLRTPSRQLGHHPEKRTPQPSSNPRQIERFHQTLKRWLVARPRPASIAELQTLLDTFATIYNTQRAHRAHPGHTTPEQAYLARLKAHPRGQPSAHFRIRHDTVDQFGKLTLRHGSRLHHLGIGITHAHTPVLILVADHTVTVISKNRPPRPQQPPHRPRPQLLAQPTKTPRPMAGAICHR